MTDRVGQWLGNYRLIRLLGRGGFADVYLGEHVRLGTYAAVKVLYTRLANTSEVQRLEKEARTIAHLNHPHIVRVLDFDVIDDTPFLCYLICPTSIFAQTRYLTAHSLGGAGRVSSGGWWCYMADALTK